MLLLFHFFVLTVAIVSAFGPSVISQPKKQFNSSNKNVISHRNLKNIELQSGNDPYTIEDDMTKDESKGMTTLRFRGLSTFKSEPFPLSDKKGQEQKMIDFFAQQGTVYNLLAGLENIVEDGSQNISTEILNTWARESRLLGGEEPSLENNDKVYCVTTGMNFPGIHLKTSTLIGSKLLVDSKESTYPEYQMVLLKSNQSAEGNRFLVWVFNKLTGSSDDSREQGTHSLSRFTVEENPDKTEARFKTEASIEIEAKFPSILLKILPVSKEKAEEQGSASVSKALEKDIQPALTRVRDSYLQWLQKESINFN